MMEVVDLDVIQNIGVQGVGCLGYLEKWLRKRPPMEPIPPPEEPPEEGVNVGDEAEPPADHQNEAQNVGQQPVQPDIVSDAISEQVDPGTIVSFQHAEGAAVSSLAAHLGSLENFSLSPFFSYSPCMGTQSPLDAQWFASAVANIGVPDTCFVHQPALKRTKTSHVDGVASSAAHVEVTQSRDDLLGSGPSSALQVEVQVEAEGDGVVSGAVQAEVHVEGGGDGVVTQGKIHGEGVPEFIPFLLDEDEEVEDDTPPLVLQRKSQRQPHPAECGTGSHKFLPQLKCKKKNK